jgi:hypothetical protein
MDAAEDVEPRLRMGLCDGGYLLTESPPLTDAWAA